MIFVSIIVIAVIFILISIIWFEEMFGMFFVAIIFLMPVFLVWAEHAKNLATMDTQDALIEVFIEQRSALRDTLDSFEYPEGSLLDADAPVASVVAELARVEKEIVTAKAVKIKTMQKLIARKYGPMGGITWFMPITGDIDDN